MFCGGGGSTQSTAEQRTPRELQRAATGLQQRPNREGSVLSRTVDTLAMDLGLKGRTTGYLAELPARQAASMAAASDSGDSDGAAGSMISSRPAAPDKGFVGGQGYFRVTYKPQTRTAEAGKGYDPSEIGKYVEVLNEARKAAGVSRKETPESLLSKKTWEGANVLRRYLSSSEVNQMTERQKLAAFEIFSQQEDKNRFLSAEDIEFIKAGAGGEGDVIYSPTEVVLPRSADRTEAARYVRPQRPERAARAPKPPKPQPVSKAKGGTIFTSMQGLGEPAAGQVGRRRSLIGA
jgi:hypothetical protein